MRMICKYNDLRMKIDKIIKHEFINNSFFKELKFVCKFVIKF